MCRYRPVGWKKHALRAAGATGLLPLAARRYGRDRLTVLAYHRVVDPARPAGGHLPNVSADAPGFAAQLDWVGDRFDVISLGDLLAWLDGDGSLPRRPLLITFDDGYRDNLEVAAPLLAERGMPAVLFLATGPLDGGAPFHWDLVAEMFAGRGEGSAEVPGVGRRWWRSAGEAESVADEFVAATKRLPPSARREALESLGEVLGVAVPRRLPGLYLDWELVRSMEGWEFGAHTVDHPVLTAVDPDEAYEQVAASRSRIEAETGVTVRAFAYPNGMSGDYGGAATAAVAAAGIDLAFTLEPGPARRREVRSAPLEVRRTYVNRSDGLPRFAAMVMGLPRMLGSWA